MKKIDRTNEEKRMQKMVTRNWIIAIVALGAAIACYFFL